MNLQVEYNCPEEIDDILNVGTNKFCFKCDKKVHDLSGLSEKEMKDFFELNKKACCSVPYDFIEIRMKKSVRFFAAILFVFGSTLFSIDGYSQTDSIMQNNNRYEDYKLMIKGHLKDSYGEPLAFGNIWIEDSLGNIISAVTDLDGFYHVDVRIENKFDSKGFIINTSYLGYTNVVYKVKNNTSHSIVHDIEMSELRMPVMMIGVIIPYRSRCIDGPAVIDTEQLDDMNLEGYD